MLLHRWSAAISILLSSFGSVSAQSTSQDSPETLIRGLDRAEAEGLLHRDSTALRRIWARDFTVNNPRNSITRGSEEVIALIRNGTIDYSSFVREIETILFHGNTVIVTGAETIKPVNKLPLLDKQCAAALHTSG